MLVFDQLKKNDPQLRLLAITIFCGLLALLLGLWWVQIVSFRDYQAHLETQSFKTVRMPAPRGKILDRNGAVLAENRPNYSVGLYFEDLSGAFRDEYKHLRPTRVLTNSPPFWKRWLGASAVVTQYVRLNLEQREELERRARYNATSKVVQRIANALQRPLTLDPNDFHKQYYQSRAMPYAVIKVANESDILRFEEQLAGKVAADLEVQSVRVYPFGTTAAHVLGVLHHNTDHSFPGEDADYDYRLPDYRGDQGTGIEHAFDAQLRGRAGTKCVLVNNLGYRQSEDIWTPVQPGHNVVLTIDVAIQRATEDALRDAPVNYSRPVRGAAVVMDVNTGDILAMASSPTFDPNLFVRTDGLSHEEYQRLQALTAEKNRATQENYHPGSIFKPIVSLACLENHMDPNAEIEVVPDPRRKYPSAINVRGQWIGDTVPPGKYNFERALINSCNSYFISNGLRYGFARVVELARRLHLGESTGLATAQDLNGLSSGLGTLQEVRGNLPSDKRLTSRWTTLDAAFICFGQGEIDVTPLQMTVLASALANGGKVLWPRIVDRIEPQDSLSTEAPTVYPSRRVRDTLGVSARSMKILRDAMLKDVEDQAEGTGHKAYIPGFHICSKTGTAQVAPNGQIDPSKQTTWFLSFAPYENPRYAVVVMVEGGSSGGGTCAPVAKKIYEAILRNEKVNAAKTGTLAQTN